MPTIDRIERAAGRLSALLDELPDSDHRQHALEHVKAVLIYARAALPQEAEATVPSGEPESSE